MTDWAGRQNYSLTNPSRAAVQTQPAAVALVVASALYMPFLCFMNTQVAPASNAIVMLFDGLITVAALVLAARRHAKPIIVVVLVLLAFFCLQRLATPEFSVKPLRDILAATAFLYLGKSCADLGAARSALLIIGGFVLGFGLWEYLDPESYTQYFNVRSFYIARGLVDPDSPGATQLFTSGTRPFDRLLFPSLGQHRVSSIFLEPVSMGNFGAILAAWALARQARLVETIAVAAVAAVVIIFADARFAMGATLLFIIARAAPVSWTRALTLVLPMIGIVICIAAAAAGAGGDTTFGRLGGSGRAIEALTIPELLGFGADGDYTTPDSGYYYVLKSFGVPFATLLWAAYAFLEQPSAEAARFKFSTAIFISALLCVSSTSLFALKTAALLWFLLGVLIATGARRQQAHG